MYVYLDGVQGPLLHYVIFFFSGIWLHCRLIGKQGDHYCDHYYPFAYYVYAYIFIDTDLSSSSSLNITETFASGVSYILPFDETLRYPCIMAPCVPRKDAGHPLPA